MTAVLGALLLAVTVVLYRLAYIHHRRPVRSAWARNGLASTLVQFVILTTLSAGLCFAIQFFVTVKVTAITLPSLATVLTILGATVGVLRVLNRQWRGFLAELPQPQAEAMATQGPANDPGSGLPPHRGVGGGKIRRAS